MTVIPAYHVELKKGLAHHQKVDAAYDILAIVGSFNYISSNLPRFEIPHLRSEPVIMAFNTNNPWKLAKVAALQQVEKVTAVTPELRTWT